MCKYIYISKHETKSPVTIIKNVVLYGCEIWAVTEESISTLKICEQKILRDVLG